MELRHKIRSAYQTGLNVALRPVVYKKIESLKNAGVEFESFNHAFMLGYLSGMENPSFDAVIESIRVMKMFDTLDDKGKEIILLVIDGMKTRYAQNLNEGE